MQRQLEEKLLGVIARLIDDFMDDKVDTECPHCEGLINPITFKDIEKWLKGEK